MQYLWHEQGQEALTYSLPVSFLSLVDCVIAPGQEAVEQCLRSLLGKQVQTSQDPVIYGMGREFSTFLHAAYFI